MKLAFIGGRDIHTLGGIETYIYNLASQLAKKGYEPVVYCESDREEVEWVNGFKVIHWKSVGGRFLCKILLGFRSTCHALFFEKGMDIFHYNAWPPSLSSWLPRLYGRTVVLEGHGLEWKRTKYSGWQQKIMQFMEWFTAKIHSHCIMVSQEQSDYFLLYYNRNCLTIPTATNLPAGPVRSDILQRYGLDDEGYYLYLGRLVPDKNPDVLIQSFLKASVPNKKLVIAGANASLPRYVASLHELAKGSPDIIFTGAVYGADKEKLLEKCFVFCIPSTIEGLAITLLEAMSFGRICLASDIPANREGLGKSGIWCKVEDVEDLSEKISYTVANYEHIEWQKTYNYNRVKDLFTWDVISDRYISFIRTLLS